MKKIISWGMMLAAAFTLTNCAKEIENPNEQPETGGYPFEIVASTVDTKTVNDGMSTKWAAEDQINLIHKESGNTEASYVSEEAFTIASEDLADGRFTGTLANPLVLGNHDWYVLYPYSSFTKTPEKSGYLPIGCEPAKSQVQIQEGNSSMAHIAGPNYPLWGNVKGVAHDEKPEVQMSHVSSLIKVVVTNVTDTPLTVENIEFAAPVDIVGTYYINFAGEKVECTNSGNDYVSKTATLKVNNGAAIEAGKSAEFYLAVRPFTAEAGSSLTLAVNGYSKVPKALTNDVTFHAGKIKTLNFDYAKVEEPEPEGVKTATISFASTEQRTSYSTTQQIWENEGVVFTNSKGSSTSNVGDYSKPARFYKSSDISVTAPGNITMLEFDCSELESKYVTPFTDLGGVLNNGIVKISLDGTSSTVTFTSLNAQARANSLTVTYVLADPTAPSITAENVTDVSARGVEAAELTYEIANLEYSDLTVTCDGTVVTSVSKGEDGVINYAVSANLTTSARDGSITISNGTLGKEVKVSQLAPVFTVARDAVELGATKDSKTTVTVTSDFDWELSMGGTTGYSVTPTSYTWAEGGKETVTIQATADRTEEGVANLGTITIVNSTTGQKLTIEVTQATSYKPETGGGASDIEATLSFADKAQRTSFSTLKQVWEQNGITFTNDKSSSTTNVADYAKPVRLYANSKVTVEAPGNITKIVFDCNSASYATAMKNSIGDAATASSDEVTVTLDGTSTSFVVAKLTAQVRLDALTVTYQE